MPQFITLQINLGGTLFVRPEEISAINPLCDSTVIILRGRESYYVVKNSAEEILDFIKANEQQKDSA